MVVFEKKSDHAIHHSPNIPPICRTKANELVLNTETIYNSGLAAIQRRTSKSRRKSTAVRAAQPLLEEEVGPESTRLLLRVNA